MFIENLHYLLSCMHTIRINWKVKSCTLFEMSTSPGELSFTPGESVSPFTPGESSLQGSQPRLHPHEQTGSGSVMAPQVHQGEQSLQIQVIASLSVYTLITLINAHTQINAPKMCMIHVTLSSPDLASVLEPLKLLTLQLISVALEHSVLRLLATRQLRHLQHHSQNHGLSTSVSGLRRLDVSPNSSQKDVLGRVVTTPPST